LVDATGAILIKALLAFTVEAAFSVVAGCKRITAVDIAAFINVDAVVLSVVVAYIAPARETALRVETFRRASTRTDGVITLIHIIAVESAALVPRQAIALVSSIRVVTASVCCTASEVIHALIDVLAVETVARVAILAFAAESTEEVCTVCISVTRSDTCPVVITWHRAFHFVWPYTKHRERPHFTFLTGHFLVARELVRPPTMQPTTSVLWLTTEIANRPTHAWVKSNTGVFTHLNTVTKVCCEPSYTRRHVRQVPTWSHVTTNTCTIETDEVIMINNCRITSR